MNTTAHLKVREEMVEREIEAFGMFGAFHRDWLLRQAPGKIRKHLHLARHKQYMMMARQTIATIDYAVPTADFTARNTSASELNIIGDTANGNTPQAMINQYCAIAPNDPVPGKVYKINFGGIISTTGTPTSIWTPRWGDSPTVATNVTLGASQTITNGSAIASQPFFGEFIFIIRTAPPGATAGTGKGHGFCIWGSSTTATVQASMGKTAATIDTTGQGTAHQGLTMNHTWGTSSASNTLTCEAFILQALN